MKRIRCKNGKHYIIVPFGAHLVKECDCKMKIKPDENCKDCHGTGEVHDSVPYGSTNVLMPSLCNCVESQLPDDYDGEEIELDTTDLEFK